MIDQDTLAQAIEADDRRRAARRDFLRTASQLTIAAGGTSLLAACGGSGTATPTPTSSSATPTPSPSSTDAIRDTAALNFALQLAYLQAQFFTYATTGSGVGALPASTSLPGGGAALLTGPGGAAPGTVTGGRAVTFTDPLVGEYAREIAADDLAHLKFLRSAIGSQATAMPAIDIDGSATRSTGAFTQAARLANYDFNAGASVLFGFDPYAGDLNFLLAAFFLKDVAVTAYKGAATVITAALYLDSAGGLLSTQAYHAGLIRTTLYVKGQGALTQQFSDARDGLDGSTDIDQGTGSAGGTANISPTDAQGRVYTRTSGQVLNIAYLNAAAVTSGGFFPAGVNGSIKTSANSSVAT
ncbi:ferritin-like domain-containing protein [Sphingomonas immobilis]|uniref:Ferritin-like domain-containing protein n=1 Tax=Sphingomonas immobilis TaxID=3063997 RepID=A0ABT8ZVM3_9SPHN|nr:ferritin-like domain-containing protein [Sphingomonas sp. CA1-15]MDO7841630.1 ferritin-like domain-containing protein [Sphingomonas sp. CA1-15]